MAKRGLGADTGLSFRMGVVLLILTALYLAFLAFLAAMGVPFRGLVLFAALLLGAQYFFSGKLVLLASGAREVSPQQAPELHARIERLAMQMDLPKPRVALMETDIPNAFATGRSQKSSVVAVTRGLLQRLDGAELDSVLAHELSHVANRDVMVMTLASFFSTVAFFLVRWLLYMPRMGGSQRERGNSAAALFLVWVISMLVWAISTLLLRALSRYREFAADRGSALTTGAPSTLASALQKISGTVDRIPQQDLRQVEAASAFFIIPVTGKEFLVRLLSTHPPLEQRLQELERIQREMEQR
ncbi:peptidase M48 Ste24p [Nitrosococcus halophilus Nc 4]|uniref:Protease HtpX n=1 Tax=Nitrosococcus halophilus (strain Nc4) TaxID=472759 RepID=D5BUM8_NITHN|nr:zinc metalloprotease HtpX [Nitrosococcus halophilus]ADE13428.1 peptidase M48 Ste24p [Nitrosococcus halophilus Nc 4]